MRTEIRAGATIDTLDATELRTIMEELLSGYLRPPLTLRFDAGATLDSSGDAIIPVYQAELGYLFKLTRLLVAPAGYTFASPYATAGAVQILRNGELVDGYPFGGSSGGSLPAVYTQTESHAPQFRDGELLQVQLLAGPESTATLISVQGILEPLPPA